MFSMLVISVSRLTPVALESAARPGRRASSDSSRRRWPVWFWPCSQLTEALACSPPRRRARPEARLACRSLVGRLVAFDELSRDGRDSSPRPSYCRCRSAIPDGDAAVAQQIDVAALDRIDVRVDLDRGRESRRVRGRGQRSSPGSVNSPGSVGQVGCSTGRLSAKALIRPPAIWSSCA